MSRIDFNKAERLLEEGIRSFSIKQLHYLADLSTSMGIDTEEKQSAFDDMETQTISLMTLAQNLKDLSKKDKEIFKSLGIKKEQIKKYIEQTEKLTAKDWQEIQRIRSRLNEYRKEMRAKFEKVTDDDIIKSEMKRHVNKRFNVNDKWLPLH